MWGPRLLHLSFQRQIPLGGRFRSCQVGSPPFLALTQNSPDPAPRNQISGNHHLEVSKPLLLFPPLLHPSQRNSPIPLSSSNSFNFVVPGCKHTGHRTQDATASIGPPQPLQPHGTSPATFNASKGLSSSCLLSIAQDSERVTLSFTQMLLKNAVRSNPVKVAFSIAKIILQIKDVRKHSSHWPLTDHDVRVWKKISMRSTNGSYRRQISFAWWGKHWMVGV